MSGQVLEGKRGIITGGAGGIGMGCVRAFLAAGAEVAIFDLPGETLDAAARGLESESVLTFPVDVTDEAAVYEATDAVAAKLGGVDYLVTCAGIRFQASFMDHTADMFTRTLAVNLVGMASCGRAAAQHMLRQGAGKIVNIASIVGELAIGTRPAYVASKHAVVGLTKAMAYELAGQNINVNAIGPGVIETPLTAAYFRDEQRRQAIIDSIPSGHWAGPAEIGDPAVFLCSDAARYIHGTTLFVDGGWNSGKGFS